MNIQPMNQLALRLALLALLALVSATALAGDLPVQAERIWAPTGDLIGQENYVTATFNVLDAYGDPAKIGEDTQLLEEKFGSIDIISPWFEFDYTDYYYKTEEKQCINPWRSVEASPVSPPWI